jgi:hypothetical protein
MPQHTLYAVVRLTVDVVDETALDNVADRISAEADYNVTHEDDICHIVDTELIHIGPDPRV